MDLDNAVLEFGRRLGFDEIELDCMLVYDGQMIEVDVSRGRQGVVLTALVGEAAPEDRETVFAALLEANLQRDVRSPARLALNGARGEIELSQFVDCSANNLPALQSALNLFLKALTYHRNQFLQGGRGLPRRCASPAVLPRSQFRAPAERRNTSTGHLHS